MLKRIFQFAVICLFTISGRLPAQWVQTNGPSSGAVTCLAASGANLIAGTDPGGVFLSTDNGATWSATSLMNTHVSVLVVAGQNLFAGTQGDGVYLSTNNGKNWTWVSSGLRNTYVTALVLSGTNLFAGTSGGVFLSTDNGSNWTAVNYGLPSTPIQSLGISGAYLFAGLNSGGVFLSTDNGTNWGYSGLTTAVAYTFCSPGTKLFAGTNKGVFLSPDKGTSWSAVSTGLVSNTVNALVVSGVNLFAGTGGGVYLSTNNGAGWAAVNSGVTPGLDTSIYCLAVSGTNMFAGTAHGVRMRPLSEMVTGATTIALVSGNNQTAVIRSALSEPFGVRVTDAGGNPVSGVSVNFALTSVPTGATGQSLSTVTTTTNSSGQASSVLTLGNKAGTYAVTASSSGLSGSPVTFTATATNLAPTLSDISTTRAGRGSKINVTLTGTNFVDGISTANFGADITVNSQTVSSGTQIGINITISVTASLGPRDVTVTNSGPGGGTATLSGGFTVDASIPTSAQSPQDAVSGHFVVYDAYPNPFNPSTNISFGLPSKSFVSLKVFDALGREVSNLVAEELRAGTYSRQWNASNVPSGIYFYRLQTGEYLETKKMILLK